MPDFAVRCRMLPMAMGCHIERVYDHAADEVLAALDITEGASEATVSANQALPTATSVLLAHPVAGGGLEHELLYAPYTFARLGQDSRFQVKHRGLLVADGLPRQRPELDQLVCDVMREHRFRNPAFGKMRPTGSKRVTLPDGTVTWEGGILVPRTAAAYPWEPLTASEWLREVFLPACWWPRHRGLFKSDSPAAFAAWDTAFLLSRLSPAHPGITQGGRTNERREHAGPFAGCLNFATAAYVEHETGEIVADPWKPRISAAIIDGVLCSRELKLAFSKNLIRPVLGELPTGYGRTAAAHRFSAAGPNDPRPAPEPDPD